MTDPEIIERIKISEGWPKFTNRDNDLGGPTKGGITLDTLRVWRHDPTIGVLALKSLKEDEADAIYQFLYVQPFEKIPDAALRYYLIDLGVLRGPRKAVMMLQDVVGVDADGWIGAQTLKAMVPYVKHLLVMLIGARFAHIADRVRTTPSQLEFKAGWRNRNARFLP